MQKIREGMLRYGPALALMLAIFWFSAAPGEQVALVAGPVIDHAPRDVRQIIPAARPLRIDWLKAGHGVGYALLGAAYLNAVGPSRRWAGGLAVLAAALYAVTDEIHQQFVPGRGSSPADVALDTAAAAAAVLLVQLARWRLARRAAGS